MAQKSTSVVPVADIERSITFYRDHLGLEVTPAGEHAAVVEPDGWPLLLAEPGADNLEPYLSGMHETVKPGATLHRFSSELDELHGRLRNHELAPVLHETTWGDRTLTIDDPDGYRVSFWTTPTRTTEETVALYAAGPDSLEAVLAGLSADELDWKPADDEWSVREIVHHVVDSDATALFRVKMALAEPGRVMLGNPYHPDTWARSLDYAGRDIAPALALLRATRTHILQLLDHLPDALERSIQNPEGEATTVETFISMLASHLLIHVDQIKATLAAARAGNPDHHVERLRGPHREVWDGGDAQEYIDRERDERRT